MVLKWQRRLFILRQSDAFDARNGYCDVAVMFAPVLWKMVVLNKTALTNTVGNNVLITHVVDVYLNSKPL